MTPPGGEPPPYYKTHVGKGWSQRQKGRAWSRSLGPSEILFFLPPPSPQTPADDHSSQGDFPPREGYVRYGSLVQLVCTVTGITLPPMVWEGGSPRSTRKVTHVGRAGG